MTIIWYMQMYKLFRHNISLWFQKHFLVHNSFIFALAAKSSINYLSNRIQKVTHEWIQFQVSLTQYLTSHVNTHQKSLQFQLESIHCFSYCSCSTVSVIVHA